MSEQALPGVAEAARRLADAHYNVEPVISSIRLIETNDPLDQTIRLLEVNPHTFPSGITPVGFGPNPSGFVPFPYVIVEVTPSEYEDVVNGTLPLRHGWRLGIEFERPSTLTPPS